MRTAEEIVKDIVEITKWAKLGSETLIEQNLIAVGIDAEELVRAFAESGLLKRSMAPQGEGGLTWSIGGGLMIAYVAGYIAAREDSTLKDDELIF